MGRALRISAFVGLLIGAVWGMALVLIFMLMDPTLTRLQMTLTLVAYAHFVVLSVLALILGFSLEYYDVIGYSRLSIVVTYVLTQWLLPLTLLAVAFVSPEAGYGILVLGALLFIAMAQMVRIALIGRR